MKPVLRLLKRLTGNRAAGRGLYGRLKIELRRAASTKAVRVQGVGASLSTRDGLWRQEEVMIDREVDRYLHRITDPHGTVVRHDEGRLSDHRGHGSAGPHKAPGRGARRPEERGGTRDGWRPTRS